jgi:predicted transposase YbfD/YdcC
MIITGTHHQSQFRKPEVINDLKSVDESQLQWKNLTCTRELRNAKTTESRWYVSSLDVSAQLMKQYIPNHWQVENSLH